MKVLIYVVCYNAEEYIRNVLERIPKHYRDNPDCFVLVSDDCSSDNTAQTASLALKELLFTNYEVFKTKVNQGYGGNQKIGYTYACDNNFDYVVLLHGDGQYAPEELGNFFELFKSHPDVILGSRMLLRQNALKGGMPLIRFISNIALTAMQNFLAHSNFAEFHTGYRAYSTKFLKEIPFELNSNGFDFDTDILLQAKFLGKEIKEFPITTHYGTEKCSVKLFKYGFDILKTSLKYRMQQMGIGCSLKFRGSKRSIYKDKFAYKYSSHYYLLETIRFWKPKRILEIGCGAGYLGEKLKDDNIRVTGIDILPLQSRYYDKLFQDSVEEFDWGKLGVDSYDMVCLMDVLEHLKEPEDLLLKLRGNPIFENALFVASVPNLAFFSIRLGLLFGSFNYADRGILDIAHKRLFTYGSFHKMLKECGFKIEKTIPIPPAFKLVSKGLIADVLSILFNILCKIAPSLFSFQMLKLAHPVPTSINVIKKSLQKY